MVNLNYSKNHNLGPPNLNFFKNYNLGFIESLDKGERKRVCATEKKIN